MWGDCSYVSDWVSLTLWIDVVMRHFAGVVRRKTKDRVDKHGNQSVSERDGEMVSVRGKLDKINSTGVLSGHAA